ncbi:50S ribosomal protein L29, chloroplastic [Tanacetum coccineum]
MIMIKRGVHSGGVVMMAKKEEELKEIRAKTTEEITGVTVDLKRELFMLTLQRSSRNEFMSSEFHRPDDDHTITSSNTSSRREVGGSFAILTHAINSSQHDIHMYILYHQSLCLHHEVFQISLIEFNVCVGTSMASTDANNRQQQLVLQHVTLMSNAQPNSRPGPGRRTQEISHWVFGSKLYMRIATDFDGCMSNNLNTRVIGCPKTIDEDLKCKEVPTSFGFDTACEPMLLACARQLIEHIRRLLKESFLLLLSTNCESINAVPSLLWSFGQSGYADDGEITLDKFALTDRKPSGM